MKKKPQKGTKRGRGKRQRLCRVEESDSSDDEWQPWKEEEEKRRKPRGRGETHVSVVNCE